MKTPPRSILICLATLSVLHQALAQQEIPTTESSFFQGSERRLSADGKEMMHMHLQTTPLYGNSTDFMYYFMTMYFGSHRQPQTLIVDTGSSVAAIPCKEYCQAGKCGNHINQLYQASKSEDFKLYDCQQIDCRCADSNRCRFYQGYAEGSRYEGFVAKDVLHFGENFHYGIDSFEYTFGCVHTETKYFYSQEADGILGLSSERPSMNLNRFEPIYDVMYEQKIIEKRQFAMCLGKNGGYFQIGGYDGTGHLDGRELKWVDLMYRNNDFKVPLRGLKMNNHLMKDTDKQRIAFVDSGTTFTYVSTAIYNAIKLHFQWFCSVDAENHCKGRMDFSRQGYLCFSYSEKEFPDGPYDYFRSFPILRFQLGKEEEDVELDWFPSEYMYRENSQRYCVALDIQNGNEMIIGGTLMRQHNFVFDVDASKLGIARASCNEDPNMVKSEQELIIAGQRYALDPTHTESLNQVCNHGGSSIRPSRKDHAPDPQPRVEDVQEPEEVSPPVVIGPPGLEEEIEPIIIKEEEYEPPVVTEPVKEEPAEFTTLPIEEIPIAQTTSEVEDPSQTTLLINKQEQSLTEITESKNGVTQGDSEKSRKKHKAESGPPLLLPITIVALVSVACVWLAKRYFKGRGDTDEQMVQLGGRRTVEQYSHSDATAQDSQPDGLGEHTSISSARVQRGRVSSNRSGDAHKLELHPDSHSRRQEQSNESSEEEYEEELDQSEEESEEKNSPESVGNQEENQV